MRSQNLEFRKPIYTVYRSPDGLLDKDILWCMQNRDWWPFLRGRARAGGSSCSLCSIFCETENLPSPDFPFITPRTHRRCCAVHITANLARAPCAAAVAWKQRIKIEISAASISAPDLCSSVSPVFCSLQ